MRVFFCFVPAAALAVPVALLEPTLAGVGFAALFGLGWQVTEAKPERGEH